MEDLQFQDLSRARWGFGILVGLISLSLLLLACGYDSGNHAGEKSDAPPAPAITVETLYRKAIDGEDMFVIDVRTEPEYRAARLDFADIRITHDSIGANLQALPRDTTTPIYSFCRGGVRSGVSTRYLRSIGYVNAYNVSGGMLAWQEKGYPTVSDSL